MRNASNMALRIKSALTLLFVSGLALSAPSAASACPGDCDGGGTVSIAELIRAVNIALGLSAVESCVAADLNGDGVVNINELISAVNAALSGCPPATPVATSTPGEQATATATAVASIAATPTAAPTGPATATPTPGAPLGIFVHPNSVFQLLVLPPESVTAIIILAVDQVADETAQVSLVGPGGSTEIPFVRVVTIAGHQYAQYVVSSPQPTLSYEVGETYTLSIVASIGTAAVEFTTVGGITIAEDGSQVSWQVDGEGEQIQVFSPAQTVGFNSPLSDKTSPFLIPVSAYGSGPATYRILAEVRQNVRSFTGAAPGSSLLLSNSAFAFVVPPVVGDTHTPTQTSTPSPTWTPPATATPTPTNTATPTITGTIPPTPVLIGEILFESTRNGGRHIYVMDADGNNVVQLTDDAGADREPEWNSDKTLIAFTRDDRLHLMNGDGSDAVPLRPAGSQYAPTFSPDGGEIVFAELLDTRINLFAYRLADDQVTQLTDGQWTDTYPTFSPDGQHVFFVSTRDSTFGEIYRMNADGTEVMRVTDNANFEQLGEVSPDGESLAFVSRLAASTESLGVFLMNLSDFTVEQLTPTDDTIDDENPLWSPDGNYIAYRPFFDGRARVFRMQANGLFMTDLTPIGASEVAGDWK